MQEARRKLAVLGGPPELLGQLAAALGPTFEIVEAKPGTTISEATPDVAILTVDPEAFGVSGATGASLSVLLDTVGEGVALVAATGEVIWGNELYRKLGSTILERVGSVCRGLAVEQGGKRGRAVSTGPRKFEASTADGTRWFGVTVVPFVLPGSSPTEAPKPARFVVVTRDVTSERGFRMKVEAIDRAGADLLSFDAEAVRKIHPVDRLRIAEEKITRAAHDIFSFDHFAIRVLDEKTGRLALTMQHGMPPEFGDIDIFAKAEGNGISGYVAATGQSYLCNDISNDPLFLPGLPGARCSLTVPLKLADKTIGIMNVESRDGAAFGDDDRLFSEMFGRYIAVALHTLDLLVVERSSTNEVAGKRVESEVGRPLDVLIEHIRNAQDSAQGGSALEWADRLLELRQEAESLRDRTKGLSSGGQTVFAAEYRNASPVHEPLMVSKRVLIADDEARVRKIIGDVLRHHGCDVTLVDSGNAAIHELETTGKTKPFDLVISDIKMPDKTGYEVFTAARLLRSDMPVILMTGFGYDPHHSIVRASQSGCKQVLFKPFEAQMLLEEVRKALTAATA